MSERFLIINADDLGLSEEINAGILQGLIQGFVSDTSLLVKAPFSGQAFSGLKSLGIGHAGIHINLDNLLGWEPGGIEHKSRQMLRTLMNDQAFLRACTLEAKVQIEIFLSSGLIPTHLDTHHHVHGFLPVFAILLALLEEYRIPAIRFSRHGYRLPTREDIPYENEVYQHMEDTLRLNRIFFCTNYLEGADKACDAGKGITELVVHPSRGGELWRSKEMESLMTGIKAVRTEESGMKLISYKDALGYKIMPS
jgi:predicted glycoside hydrolase/deacetylase ChbG (UPF0249 family)